ncbi:MAG: hypothetical protein ACK5KU_09590 [Beutenbergiaceae bacterium]
MVMQYRYMRRWNPGTLRPIGSEPYLDEAQARRHYEEGGEAFEVIPEPDPMTGIPAWQMHVFTGDGSFEIWHFDERGFISRVTGFRVYDGPLFHDAVLDYFYSDEVHQGRWQGQSAASSIITAYIKPDGTSKVIYKNVVPGQETVQEYRNVVIDSYWAERPVFGRWADIANPNFGDVGSQQGHPGRT